MSQKELEQRCFDDMLTFGVKGTSKRTKQIIKKFKGDVVPRSHDESPDFLIKNGSRNGVNRYIGVEHFEVDHKSFRKRGKPQSGYKRLNSQMINIVDPEITQLTAKHVTQLESVVGCSANQSINKNYHTLMESFKHSLYKHYVKIDEYRKNIQINTNVGDTIELAFLIEMHVDFDNMVLFDGVKFLDNRIVMPMFNDMVDELLILEKRKLDYIILVIRSTGGDGINVIPLSLRYFHQDLIAQGITSYDYFGLDFFHNAYTNHTHVKPDYVWDPSSEEIILNHKIESQLGIRYTNMMLLMPIIIECVNNNKPFMTDLNVFKMYRHINMMSARIINDLLNN